MTIGTFDVKYDTLRIIPPLDRNVTPVYSLFIVDDLCRGIKKHTATGYSRIKLYRLGIRVNPELHERDSE